MVQWLGLCTFTAEGTGSVPARGTKIPQAVQHSQKKKKVSLTFNRYEVWLICLFIKTLNKTLALDEPRSRLFLCLYLHKKVRIGNHQNKASSFLFYIHHPQPQMGLQIAWWVYSGSPQHRAWGKDQYAVLDEDEGEGVENGKWGMSKCDPPPCDAASLLPVGCKMT